MEAPIPPRSKPLSYSGLKSVIKSMSVGKRQEIHSYLPSLRATNYILPYTINEVRIRPNELSINRKSWRLGDNPEQLEENERVDQNQTTIRITDLDTMKRSRDFPLNKSLDEAFEQCFNVYFKNGTIIQNWDLCRVPKFLCERETELKLNIKRLQTYGVIVDKFDYFIRFVDLDKLEHITLSVRERYDRGREFGMLEKPAIINCKELFLKVFADRSLINYYMSLRNQHLILQDEHLHVNDLHQLIENWKSSDRPIGTRFSFFSIEDNVCLERIMNNLGMKLEETFPVNIQREPHDIQGIGLKIDENRNLVIYLALQQVLNNKRLRTHDALKMEVIERELEGNISD